MQSTHRPCPNPECTSSDGYSVDPKTGWGKCFVCEVNVPPEKANGDTLENNRHTVDSDDADAYSERGVRTNKVTPLAQVFHAIKHRSISKQAAEKFRVDLDLSDKKIEARYPYFREGRHVANKVRTKDKKFYWEGDRDDVRNVELYGQHLFPPGSAKQVTVVEGEYDAPSAWTLLGSRYPVVSVASGGTALRDVKNNFEYLDSFENIVLCFDNDEAGQKAQKQIANLFAPGKCRLMQMQHYKDPNGYLHEGKTNEFVKEWWAAPRFMPDGLKIGDSMWDEIINRPKHFQVPFPWDGLNKLTYGIRLSELIVVTAETKVGKTSILKEIEYSLLMNKELQEKGYGVGFIHLEEPNYDTALGLMSIHNSKPYHLPDTERTVEELRTAYDAVLNNKRVVIWDHFGSNSVDAVLDKIRHMHALGCKYIVLDHLSIVVSDQSGDERKQLDEITTKAKTLCMNLNIALIVVVHQNRAGSIRGTAGIEQLANIVIKLYRDKLDTNEWRRNVTKLVVENNRFSGRTGPACYLFYDEGRGRLMPLDQEDIDRYEEGGSADDTSIPF